MGDNKILESKISLFGKPSDVKEQEKNLEKTEKDEEIEEED